MGLSEETKSCSLNINTLQNKDDSLSIEVNSSILNLIRINNLINEESSTNASLKDSTSHFLKDFND